jgi:membrane protein implicated in regulation of membrane protease activity
MIVVDIIKLRWRLLVRTSNGLQLWILAASLTVASAGALSGLFYFLAWLDAYHPKVFSVLLVGWSVSFIALYFLSQVLTVLKLKRERYLREDDRS